MPELQPFLVNRTEAKRRGWRDGSSELTLEWRDTFELYGRTNDEIIVWLDRSAFLALEHEERRRQPAPHRWPPSEVLRDCDRVIRYVEFGRRPSRHQEVAESTWNGCMKKLPFAKEIAGRFQNRSGPNCFGTVMGAAGLSGAANHWIQIEPFDSWLGANAVPGGDDDVPGTVFVWRTTDGVPCHAAVTLGDGWLLHKPSQGWMSPIKVLSVLDGKYSARGRGRYLHRYTLQS